MGKSIRNFAAVTPVGLDLAKNVFQVHDVDARCEVVIARKLRRAAYRNSSPSSRYAWRRWKRAHQPITGRGKLLALGFEIKLILPAHANPYVRRNKNDAADAAAICEAAGRPGQRFVPVRSIGNQAELMCPRARELLAGQCTSSSTPCAGTWPRSGSSRRKARSTHMT